MHFGVRLRQLYTLGLGRSNSPTTQSGLSIEVLPLGIQPNESYNFIEQGSRVATEKLVPSCPAWPRPTKAGEPTGGGVKKSPRGSPRLEPKRWHLKFCDLMKCRPGELRLPQAKNFYALVGQFFVATKREEFFSAHRQGKKTQKKKRRYSGRHRSSLIDRDIWRLITALYVNQAAGIILLGEYKAMKAVNKSYSDDVFRRRLEKQFNYLDVIKIENWFATLKADGPYTLAIETTASSFGMKTPTLKRRLPEMKEAQPWWHGWLTLDRQKRLKILLRTPPRKRTRRDKLLQREALAEFEGPSFSEDTK